MKSSIRQFLHRSLHHAGLDIIRWNKVPENTLLGLIEYDINTVLDIGANIGQSARFYRQIFPKALIYSFEPLMVAFKVLNEWALRQDGKARAFNIALGDKDGMITMKEHVDFSPSSSILVRTHHSTELFPQTSHQKDVQVNMVRLDEIVKEFEIKSELLIKIDVQGFEDKVIQGGKVTFSHAVACIMEVSLQSLYEGQPSFKNLYLLMDELGFEYAGNILQVYDDKGHIIYLDALFIKPAVQ